MKIIIIGILLFSFSLENIPVIAQTAKKPLDTTVLGKWPSIDQSNISNNGLFFYYILNDKRFDIHAVTFVSESGKWELTLRDADQVRFCEIGNYAVFIKSNDSLGILELGTSNIKYIPQVNSYQLCTNSNDELVAYKKKENEKLLYLFDFQSGKLDSITSVKDYLFSNDGKVFLVKRELPICHQLVLEWINLVTQVKVKIWEGVDANNYTFDQTNSKIAFIGQDSFVNDNALYYYKVGMNHAIKLIDDRSVQAKTKFSIQPAQLFFSKNCKKLLFSLKKDYNHDSSIICNTDLSVWNYKDKYLQSEQSNSDPVYIELSNPKNVNAIIDFENRGVILLNKENEYLLSSDNFEDYVIVYPQVNEGIPSRDPEPSFFSVSTNNGKREKISNGNNFYLLSLAPSGRFIVWFDTDSLKYWSYDLKCRTKADLSKKVPFSLFDKDAVRIGRRRAAYGIAGWSIKDNFVYLYDEFDIWKIDLSGLLPSKNITNGFGRKNDIVFGTIKSRNEDPLMDSQKILLSGYNNLTKQNGIWTLDPQIKKNNLQGNLDTFCYYISRVGPIGIYDFPRTNPPKKAKNANKYIVTRMCAGSFPNLFVTDDFNFFKQISHFHPEIEYNWLTADLISWRMSDGKISQGILYKPENFDSTKKYPVIFNYYEKRSDEFYQYLEPDFSRADLNIPYFVSNGYLVFVPDIYHNRGHNGKGVLNSVISAAKYLSTFSWIDPLKLGIQGHSFGGWETNILLTHTDIFSAACEASGVSDQISAYNQLNGWGSARQKFYEEDSQGSPYGVGVTPWTNPELYIENSPVLSVGQVTTPLLMMHGDRDKAVPYAQALEMFLALKRASKNVWLLEYEKEGHVLWEDTDAKDFTIRMKQFFDHYLKNAPAPVWMTQGIPARLKGVITGYDLDPSGNCGKNCKICKMWNEKWKKDNMSCIRETKQWENGE